LNCPRKVSKYIVVIDNAGRWFDNEIVTLQNPSVETVVKEVHSAVVDYLIVYFSGHGGTMEGDRRMLELKNGLITDTDLLNTCTKQIVIRDSCSNYIRPGISGIPEFGEEYFSFDGVYTARELFDQYILHSPCGKIIVHSTQLGQPSYDGIDGGYFTQALINVATKLKTPQNYYPLSIADVLSYVPSHLQRRSNSQIPTIYAEGDLSVPFVFGFQQQPRPAPQPYLQNQNIKGIQSSSKDGLALLGLGVLVLALALGSK
jgi:Caspase domain